MLTNPRAVLLAAALLFFVPGIAFADAVAVTNVRYDHQPTKDRVVIELSESVKFSHATTPSGRSVLELEGVRLPAALERKLDVGAYGGPVTAISAYRRKSDPSRVVIEVEPRSDVIGTASRE